MISHKKGNFLVQDVAIIVLSILVAILLLKTHALFNILNSTANLKLFGSFIAGIFFTSVFTTAPAIVTLGEIAKHNSIFLTSLFGAVGAVVGDLIIFSFIKDRLSEHFIALIEHRSYYRRIRHILKLKYFRWGTFLVGGLIIASPIFPDELAISLMGFSKMRTWLFVLLSFTCNFIGVLLFCLVAKSI